MGAPVSQTEQLRSHKAQEGAYTAADAVVWYNYVWKHKKENEQ